MFADVLSWGTSRILSPGLRHLPSVTTNTHFMGSGEGADYHLYGGQYRGLGLSVLFITFLFMESIKKYTFSNSILTSNRNLSVSACDDAE